MLIDFTSHVNIDILHYSQFLFPTHFKLLEFRQ